MRAFLLNQSLLASIATVCLLIAGCGDDKTTTTKTTADAQAASDTASADADTTTGVDPNTWGRGKVRKDEDRPAGKGPLQVGVATRVIDGPVGVSMAGYGGRIDGRRTHWSDRIKGTAGFYGMQTIKVIALEVGGEKMALVKSPLMSSESYLTDAIARHLQKDHGLDFTGRVITMAGHSHHTTARYWPLPDTLGNVGADSFDAEVAERDATLFAEAIAEAWKNRAPGEWAHGTQDDWDVKDEVYRDRRSNNNPKYGKDPRLDLLAFRKQGETAPLAVVLHFAIHGTVFGGDNDMFTEDAPGYVEHKFEEAFFARSGKPVIGLFAQASGGDASPAGDQLGHSELARLELLGEAAAGKILSLYDTLQWSGADTELAIRSQRLDLIHERVYQGKPYQDEFANEFNDPYIWGGWQCNGSGVQEGESMQGHAKLCVDLGKFLTLLEAPVPHNAAHQVYLTAARLGDVWLMTMPGEPTWSITKYARDAAAKKTWNGKPMNLMVIGYSQDHFLYLTAPDDWFLGGYESEMSLWGPGGGTFFADQGLQMIDAMAAGKNGPTLYEDSPSLAPVPTFTPRAREASLNPGTIVVQPPTTVQRTQTLEFAANCGDPALGNPYVTVQKQDGANFVDVAARHGWVGRAYDNSRYELLTVYEPDPPQLKGQTVPERTHTWRFYWQVPADWAAGSYRLHLRCKALEKGAKDDKPTDLTLDSTPFAVGLADGTTLTATLADGELHVTMRVPAVAQKKTQAKAPGLGKWISAGYRLFDNAAKAGDPTRVRADLTVELVDAADQVLATVQAPWDPQKGSNVAKLTKPSGNAKTLRAWVSSDASPAKVSWSIP